MGSYDIVDAKASLGKYAVERFILSPERWNTGANLKGLAWKVVKFDIKNAQSIPDDSSGVYSFVVKPGIAEHPECSVLLYVGKADVQSLQKRFKQYFREKCNKKGRPKIRYMLSAWEDYLWFCYAPIADKGKVHGIEQTLIGAYIPPMNEQYPAEIRSAVKAF
jgi:hypothetical protein